MNQNQQQNQQQQNQQQKKRKPNRDQLSAYVKYSGLAFQMIAVLGLAVWGGLRLDAYMGNSFPVFMIVFALIAFAASIFIVVKSLPKN